jgi:hypothetical protein
MKDLPTSVKIGILKGISSKGMSFKAPKIDVMTTRTQRKINPDAKTHPKFNLTQKLYK